LTVKFKRPLYTPKFVLARGKVVKKEGKKLSLQGSFEDEGGNILAEAEGTWIIVDKNVGRSNIPDAKSKAKL
jgi:acyl-coenzyme A thioesterase PaaI-like protein